METLEVGRQYQDLYGGSLFSVLRKDGELGYKARCDNGSWYATYDPGMKMLSEFRDVWGYARPGIHRCFLVEKYKEIGY